MFTFLAEKSWWIDEGYSTLTSLVIREKWVPLYDSGFWDGAYLAFHYLQAWVFFLFWVSEWTSRIAPLVLALISLLFLYKIALNIFHSKYVGWISVLTFLFSYDFWVIATQARYYSTMMCLYLFGFYMILLYIDRRTVRSFFLALNVVFFSIFFHVYLYSLLPILALSVAYVFWTSVSRESKWSTIIERWKYILSQYEKRIFIWWALFALNTVFFYLLVREYNPGQEIGSIRDTFQYIYHDYISHYSFFFFREYGFLFLMTFVSILVCGFIQNSFKYTLLIFAFFFPFLIVSKFVFMYATRYVYFLLPLLVIIGCGTLYLMIQRFSHKWVRYAMIALSFGLVLFSLHWMWGLGAPIYINDPYAPEPNFRAAYSAIKKDPTYSTGSTIISIFPHMDYLYLGKSDYYIYVDETGLGRPPEKNLYVKNKKNIFTNVPILLSVADIERADSGNNTFIILDQLGLERLKASPILQHIQEEYRVIFEEQTSYNLIRVYRKLP